MKIDNYFVVRFEDLIPEKQETIKQHLTETIHENGEVMDYLKEQCGHDPFDMDRPNTDMIAETIEGIVETACNRAATELEITLCL